MCPSPSVLLVGLAGEVRRRRDHERHRARAARGPWSGRRRRRSASTTPGRLDGVVVAQGGCREAGVEAAGVVVLPAGHAERGRRRRPLAGRGKRDGSPAGSPSGATAANPLVDLVTPWTLRRGCDSRAHATDPRARREHHLTGWIASQRCRTRRSSTPTPTRRPLLATYSFLPIVQAYAGRGRRRRSRPATSRSPGGSSPQFPEQLTEEQRVDDALAELGALAKTPEANIIKLPNVSASIPQLKAAVKELQEPGLRPPRLPGRPADRRGAGRPGALRQGQGQRRQPGAARGQLRPPGARLGQELRPQAPALDGRLVARLEDQRRAPWAPTTSASNEKSHGARRATTTLRIELVGDDGDHHRAQGRRSPCWPARSSTPP